MSDKIQEKHHVKIVSPYYEMQRDGLKNFESRKDDRDYKVGDILVLQHYDPIQSKYTGNEDIITHITCKLTGKEWGIMEGYCLLGTKKGDGLPF